MTAPHCGRLVATRLFASRSGWPESAVLCIHVLPAHPPITRGARVRTARAYRVFRYSSNASFCIGDNVVPNTCPWLLFARSRVS